MCCDVAYTPVYKGVETSLALETNRTHVSPLLKQDNKMKATLNLVRNEDNSDKNNYQLIDVFHRYVTDSSTCRLCCR